MKLSAIPQRSFGEIIDQCFPSIQDLVSSNSIHANLTVDEDPKNIIGTGSFKSCHPAQLRFADKRFFKPDEEIGTWEGSFVVKRMVSRQAPNTGTQPAQTGIRRFTSASELELTLQEANCMLWATALMDLSYQFIASFSATMPIPAELVIPQFRMVPCAVAVSDSPKRTYLVEGRIPFGLGPLKYTKYVNNNAASPTPGRFPAHIGRFFCFLQHLQLETTGHLAFLTDFQGAGELLTDVALITRPKEKYVLSRSLLVPC